MNVYVFVDEFPKSCADCLFIYKDQETDKAKCFLSKDCCEEGNVRCPLNAINSVIEYT